MAIKTTNLDKSAAQTRDADLGGGAIDWPTHVTVILPDELRSVLFDRFRRLRGLTRSTVIRAAFRRLAAMTDSEVTEAIVQHQRAEKKAVLDKDSSPDLWSPDA